MLINSLAYNSSEPNNYSGRHKHSSASVGPFLQGISFCHEYFKETRIHVYKTAMPHIQETAGCLYNHLREKLKCYNKPVSWN
jgi:hypothetical protein